MAGIGLLNEKHLHASLKEWYGRPGDRFEVSVEGYVIDIVRGDLLLEIQTGSFAAVRSKLTKLARTHPVRLIYPIAQEKWIIKGPTDDGRAATRRRSPRRGRLEDLFWEMVSLSQFPANPNFSLEVLLTREEEMRRYDGKRGWRSSGWITEERRLIEVAGQRLFEQPEDWRALLPEGLEETFTAKDVAQAVGIRGQLAQRMAYCLSRAGTIRLTGKRGRANLYEVAALNQPICTD